MNQTLREQLEKAFGKPRAKREQLKGWKRNNREHRSKPQKRRREDLSEFEIKSLMGADMRVHKKVRGRIRQI